MTKNRYFLLSFSSFPSPPLSFYFSCAVGRHEFSEEWSSQYLKSEGISQKFPLISLHLSLNSPPTGSCGRCGNEGTHFLPPHALSELFSTSSPQILKPNDKIALSSMNFSKPQRSPTISSFPKALPKGTTPPLLPRRNSEKKKKEKEVSQDGGESNGAVVYCLEGLLFFPLFLLIFFSCFILFYFILFYFN